MTRTTPMPQIMENVYKLYNILSDGEKIVFGRYKDEDGQRVFEDFRQYLHDISIHWDENTTYESPCDDKEKLEILEELLKGIMSLLRISYCLDEEAEEYIEQKSHTKDVDK